MDYLPQNQKTTVTDVEFMKHNATNNGEKADFSTDTYLNRKKHQRANNA